MFSNCYTLNTRFFYNSVRFLKKKYVLLKVIFMLGTIYVLY